MLVATVQRHMPKFLGKPRMTGDLITSEELGQCTQTTIDALVGQKFILLSDDGMRPTARTSDQKAAKRAPRRKAA